MNPLRVVPVHQDDELAQPLLAELAVEYATRYGQHRSGGDEVAARPSSRAVQPA